MNKHFRARVIDNRPIGSAANLLTINPLETVQHPIPGQFYLVEAGDTYDPLLKRPFSYFRITEEGIQFLYAIKGKGTTLMSGLKTGDILNVIGPLGNGYPKPGHDCIPVLLAGGIGIASIFSFAESLSQKGYVLYGSKCREELLFVDELRKLGHEIILCTDDCSCGEAGNVADVLKLFLNRNPSLIKRFQLFACGPRPMLQALSLIALENGLLGYISVEENMACGVGACQGCVVNVKSQQKKKSGLQTPDSKVIYKRVCKEGPVFSLGEVAWE